MSETLPLEDVRAIVRLLGDVAIIPGETRTKKQVLLEGLAKIISADVWIWALSRVQGDRIRGYQWIEGGWASEAQQIALMRLGVSPEVDRLYMHLVVEARKLQHITRTRSQLFESDRAWYESELFKAYSAGTGLSDFMFMFYRAAPDTMSVIGFHRGPQRGPFGARERCIVHLVTSETPWLHRNDTNIPAAEYMCTLSTRQLQVLHQLLVGDSRKQIARKLELSEYTVAEYIDTIYKRFKVTTRGELLSLFMSGGGGKPS